MKSGCGKMRLIPYYGACTQIIFTRATPLLSTNKTESKKYPSSKKNGLSYSSSLQRFLQLKQWQPKQEVCRPLAINSSRSPSSLPLLILSHPLSSPGMPTKLRFPVRLDKRAVAEGSYMCRAVEAIRPRGNGVEDEEERSRETDSSCFYIRSGGCLQVCKKKGRTEGSGGWLIHRQKTKDAPPPYELGPVQGFLL